MSLNLVYMFVSGLTEGGVLVPLTSFTLWIRLCQITILSNSSLALFTAERDTLKSLLEKQPP